jgi:hypothetical protein
VRPRHVFFLNKNKECPCGIHEFLVETRPTNVTKISDINFFFFRGINSSEKKQGSYSVVESNGDKREITIKERLGINPTTKTYNFDHVFPPGASQVYVYKSIVLPIIDEVLQGYNCTIFA